MENEKNEMISAKYSGDLPDVVFSNEETTINVVVSMTENPMDNGQIKAYQETVEEMMKESGEIIGSDYYEVDRHNVGQMKVVTPAADTDIYNNMIYFSSNDKLVIVTFNCTVEHQDEWQNVGDFIIDSLFFAAE